MSIITTNGKTEQQVFFYEVPSPQNQQKSPEDPKILELVSLAKDRGKNGRKGDRALQKLIEMQQPSIQSRIRKRKLSFPMVDRDDMELAAIEGIVSRVATYDPMKGKFSSWVHFGILQGLDRVCDDCRRDYDAKKSAEAEYLPAHNDNEFDITLWEKVNQYLANFSKEIQTIITLTCEGFSYVEIGRQLGKKCDAVRMAFNRAIAKIQSWLEPVEVPVEEPLQEVKEEINQPIETVKGWMSNGLRKVVRFIQKSGKQERPDKTQTIPNEDRTMKQINVQQKPYILEGTNPPKWSFFGKGKSNQSALKLTHKGQIFFVFIIGVLLTLMIDAPANAQCAGWLCGPRDAILANEMWGASNPRSEIIVNGGFLLMQVVAMGLTAVPMVVAAAMGIRKEDYTPFAIGSIIIFIGLTAVNFIAGWIFGV